MDLTSKIELLEAQHNFPTKFTFKFIGKDDGSFVDRVIECVRVALKHDSDPPYTSRQTASGGHVSVTLTPMVSSAADVLCVYEQVGKLKDVLYSL